MTKLCPSCSSIPFRSLPTQPQDIAVYTPEGPKSNIFAISSTRLPESSQAQMEEFIRYEHKPSDTGCPICEILSTERKKLKEILEDALKDERYAYYDRMKGLSDEPMRMTKRLDGADGFLAIVRAEMPDYWFYVAAIGFCVDEADPLSNTFQGRPVAVNSGDTTGMERVASWVRICDDKHDECEKHSTAEMPNRVLDLGDETTKLVGTGSMRAPYVTLSHCWGSDGHFTTTKSSLVDRQTSIDESTLPKTFKDAIQVTRHLGLRYLWIDSLCIMQDDSSDWERESARMASVYSNSYVTIAATSASDNSRGCFGTHQRTYHDFSYTDEGGNAGTIHAFLVPLGKAYFANAWLEMRDEPLSSRGWTLQERALAPRIIHYAGDQIYYECNNIFSSEDGVRINGRFGPYGQNVDGKFRGEDQGGVKGWANIVWQYTMRKLSMPQDRLPALSGLARNYQDLLQDEYVAGMWKSHLIRAGLLWQAVGGGRRCSLPGIYRGPSWSWASIDGLIGMRERGGDTTLALAEILDLHIELKGQNPFGEVADGWLKIKAPKVLLKISDEPEKDEGKVPHARAVRFTVEGGNSYGTYSLLDTLNINSPAEIDKLRQKDIFLVPLIRYSYFDVPGAQAGEGEDDFGYQGLIITQSENGSDTFRRLGVWIFDQNDLGSLDIVDKPENVCELMLV